VRLPLPGPSDLVDAVREVTAAVNGLGRAASGAIALVPRLEGVLDRVDGLLDRAEVVLGDAERAVARTNGVLAGAEGAVQRTGQVLVDAESRVVSTAEVLVSAGASVQRTEAVLLDAERAVESTAGVLVRAEKAVARTFDTLAGADGLVDRADHLLAQAQGPLTDLMPVLRRLAETLEPQEVDAAILLVDRLPELLAAVDRDVLPLVRSLSKVEPELHEMLDIVADLHRLITGLPGSRLWRSRGEDDPQG
jgi:ABC-type transporter Mla subunit MlaD